MAMTVYWKLLLRCPSPFWRINSPSTENGGSLVRSATPGPRFAFTGHVHDRLGRPVAGAEVVVWHCSIAGIYENQDPSHAEMNLRGSFITDETGTFSFSSVKPVGYPIPIEGNVVGELLRAQNRHNYRPADVHFLIFRPGFKTLISQVFMPDDPHLEDDVQFGVTQALVGDLVRHEVGDSVARQSSTYWYSMDYTFAVDEGEAKRPRAPIE